MQQLVPLQSISSYTFTTVLGGSPANPPTSFDFVQRWNDRSQVWTLDIAVSATKAVLIEGLAILLGADLLAPYNFGIGTLVAQDLTGQGQDAGDPTTGDLGKRVILYWISSDDPIQGVAA